MYQLTAVQQYVPGAITVSLMASLCTAVCVEEGYHFKLSIILHVRNANVFHYSRYNSVLYCCISAKIADIIIQLQSEHGRQAHPQKIYTQSTFQLADRSHVTPDCRHIIACCSYAKL
jgi:hypothetical protein